MLCTNDNRIIEEAVVACSYLVPQFLEQIKKNSGTLIGTGLNRKIC